jgi:hypothetical protein
MYIHDPIPTAEVRDLCAKMIFIPRTPTTTSRVDPFSPIEHHHHDSKRSHLPYHLSVVAINLHSCGRHDLSSHAATDGILPAARARGIRRHLHGIRFLIGLRGDHYGFRRQLARFDLQCNQWLWRAYPQWHFLYQYNDARRTLLWRGCHGRSLG